MNVFLAFFMALIFPSLLLASPAYSTPDLQEDIIKTSEGAMVETEWVRRYHGPTNAINEARAIAVDNQGNVYVTGEADGYSTIKYSPTGQRLWVRRYLGADGNGGGANALALDSQGNVYVTGSAFNSWHCLDFATIKYSPGGKELWVSHYYFGDPYNGNNAARAIAVDGQGNVYVTGCSEGTFENWDYATVKYNSSGKQVWARRYEGPAKGRDMAVAMALDSQGNILVTGSSEGVATGDDYLTIKYSPQGKRLWVKRYNGPGNGADVARAMAVDGAGNVYVTGSSDGGSVYSGGPGHDYATIKYSPEGKQLWVSRYNGPGYYTDYATAIAVDGQGNIFVTGTSYHTFYNYDVATIKYNPDGQLLWVRRYNGPDKTLVDLANALALDQAGNVYVTGATETWTGSANYLTLKYSADGKRLWVRSYNGPGPGAPGDHALAVAVNNQGNVYITGHSTGKDDRRDYLTIKYHQP